MCPNTLVCLSKERKNLHALNLFLCRQRMAGLLILFSVSIFYLGSNSCLFKIMQTEEVNCIQKKVQEGRAVRRWTPKTEYVIPEKVLWKIPSLSLSRGKFVKQVRKKTKHKTEQNFSKISLKTCCLLTSIIHIWKHDYTLQRIISGKYHMILSFLTSSYNSTSVVLT